MVKVNAPISSDLFISNAMGLNVTPEYHTHNVYEIYFFIEGDVNYYVEHNCFRLKAGNILLMLPQENHRVELIDKTVYKRYSINISHRFLEMNSTPHTNLSDRLFNRPFGKPYVLFTNPEQRAKLITLFHKTQEIYHSDLFGRDVLCTSYMIQILVALNELRIEQGDMTLPNTMPVLVEQILGHINDNLPNYITLEQLSKELYHNSTYISRRFKEVTGFSIQEYILRKRIYLAQSYLQKGYSVGDSAIKAGFGDHSNFTRTFSKYVGCTPKKYQKEFITNTH